MEERFEKVKEEIKNIIKESPIEEDPVHSELVLKWVLKLKPDADEALKIAALAHDIDRAITKITESDLKDYKANYHQYKKEHAERSAQFIAEILRKNGYLEDFINKVVFLVERHEIGGDEESDILRDADSIAYFEYNAPRYLKRNGREQTKGKIGFMYSRMSEIAKELVNKMNFEDKEIEELFKEVTKK